MGDVTIKAVANRGKDYEVTFRDGKPYIVCSVYRKYGAKLGNKIERQIWQAGDDRITPTAWCAINAAKAVFAARARQG